MSLILNQCPHAGFVRLTARAGSIVMPTTCKTWGCAFCSRKMLSLFKLRVEAGCLTLGRCSLITLTYKVEEARRWDAGYVRRDWRALLRSTPQLRSPNQWMRVTELTKKGMPHHHLILGETKGRERCYGNEEFDARRFRERSGCCDCLSHVISREWFRVTGDSWNTHVTPVLGARGAAAYLGKYLQKTFVERAGLETVGVKRRWSSSRGWPGNGRMRLRLSAGPHGKTMWQVVDRHVGLDTVEWGETAALRVRVGTPLIARLVERNEVRSAIAYLKGVINDPDVFAETGPDSGELGSRYGDVGAVVALGHGDSRHQA